MNNNYFDVLRERYLFEVGRFNFLQDVGYAKNEEIKEGIRITNYVSKIFIYRIGVHFGRDENFREFISAESNDVIPSPRIGLAYFLDDFEGKLLEIKRTISLKDKVNEAILVNAELYKRNSWIFKSRDWVSDPEFISACNYADAWFSENYRGESDFIYMYEKIVSSRRRRP